MLWRSTFGEAAHLRDQRRCKADEFIEEMYRLTGQSAEKALN
jgi:hypothetical protein